MWVHPIHPISSMPMKENHAMLFFVQKKAYEMNTVPVIMVLFFISTQR
jgi:hypothetical protein